ncbi:hypothetical protein SAMN00120144_3889 [Hymenobacter roseosalivarius DSM 11622]|uniref:SusD/RagB family nutrient-binding outer membrane lipoprotein n=1 Tax=Hymenobacter roseosalivarius DSM 11622 TaxID=645990 RepID=A0A1W1UGI1_9BACT|nr:SusD/RagB family nutrient-binding outer membrane lipoprotein [Hymenobacter roseosalivarius]SMB80132.1 hypothetical protein SAMN00120144_3889 [Hymenobacter roseosalivarius DSM 11622]
MNKSYLFLFFQLLLLTVSSCEFGDYNVNPNRPKTVSLNQVLPGTQAQSASNIVSIGARVTGTVVQHFKGINAQPEGYTNYVIDERTLDAYWQTGLYAGAMKDCADLIKRGTELNQPHHVGIGKILMAFNLEIATSLWGDVPYSEAFGGKENLSPAYDTQEDVYNSIQTLLSEAIIALNEPAGANAPAGDDLIFNGSASRWTATARSLKARYYLHLTRRDPSSAAKALAELALGGITSVTTQPNFNFSLANNGANPIAMYGQERPGQLVLGDQLVRQLLDKRDPRLNKYTRLVGGNYVVYQADNTSLFWAQKDSRIPLISYAEVKFIEAEAYLRTANEARAADALAAAITANMQQLGIAAADYSLYVATYGNFRGLSTLEQKLKLLIEQKYVALYGQGALEAWVDYRRTGYPELVVPRGVEASFNPSRVVPRRYLYPISERNTNNASVEAAIQRQGGHLMDVDTWAFKP